MAVLSTTDLLFNTFEPKVQNRFLLSMGGTGIEGYLVRIAKAPSFVDQVIKLDYINTYKKIRGKREWQDMTMTLYDPITPSGAQGVMEWARKSYETVTGRAGYSDFYKEQLTLKTLGPVGDVVSEWSIEGAFVTQADFGNYDWSTDAVLDLQITVSMDYCVLKY